MRNKILINIAFFMMASSLCFADTAILQSSDGTAISASNPLQVTVTGGITSAAGWTRTGTSINLTNAGDNVGIDVAPLNKIDVNGAAAIGASYAGLQTAPSNGLIVQGNVGVGTFSAAAPLNIQANLSTNTGLRVQRTSSQYIDLEEANGTAHFIEGAGSKNLYINNLSNAAEVGQTTTGSSIVFDTQGSAGQTSNERMRIDSTGNVGIGTFITQNSAFTVMNGNVGIGTWKPAALLDIVGGNVSIGSTANTSTLHVFGGGNPNDFEIQRKTNGNYLAFGAPGGTFTSSSAYINANIVGTFFTNGGMAIGGNAGFDGSVNPPTAGLIVGGNVGIGSTVPNNELVVNGIYAQQWSSKIPVLSSCGGGTPTIKGTDNDFQITVGTTATGCTATFGRTTYSDASCTVSNQTMSITSALGYTVSPTAIVISQGVGLSGDLLNVHCGFKN